MPLDSTAFGPHPSPAGRGAVFGQSETTTVVLHGRLAKIYGRRHQLSVRSAAEAAHALCSLHPGFKADFQDGYYRVIRGSVANGLPLTEGMLTMRIGRAGEIHFVPAARGAKSGTGVGKAILGAVIVVAAVAFAVATAGAGVGIIGALGATSALGVSYGTIAFFGASLLLSGISSIISPQPKNNSTVTDPRQSFGLSGNSNSTTQGSAIPVVYGRTRVGSIVGSFGYEAVEYAGTPDTSVSAAAPAVDISSPTGGEVYYGTGSGGGGKSGSSSGGAKEAPNTLRSNAIVRVIDILSEGPIGGLVDGAKSIFFNGTPLMAADGTYNFLGVSYQVRLGYPDQDPVDGFPAAEETIQVGTQVKQQQPKIQTIVSQTANAARVTVRIPALVTQNSTNGNLEAGPDLDFKFEVRPTGGDWTLAVLDHISGQKCTSPYQRSYRFALPNIGTATTWDIRMTRMTSDSLTSNVQNDTYFDAVTVITDHKLIYPNTAYIAFQFDASAFGSQVPTRSYEIDGILCQVPLNYDALGHTYATSGAGTSMGTWDGASWKLATTSNPAWCFYDMLANTRYGTGLPASAVSITRYDLFTISQYCDGLVPTGYLDGNGNATAELRYAMNVAMTTQEDAYKVIQSMVSAFRGATYWGAGRVVVTADMPTVPSSVLNQTNVIDGTFTYEGTPLKTRHTVARVAWQDPQNSYQTTIEVVEDFDQVVTLGQVTTDIVAFGCTSRGLAHRLGKWLLDTEKTQTETLNCQVGMEHLALRPGDVAIAADPAYAGIRMGGRCPAGSTNTRVKLDSSFVTSGELLYTITVTLPDGTVASDVICDAISYDAAFNGTNCIAELRTTLPLAPATNATWVLSSAGTEAPHGPSGIFPVAGRQFRILGLAEPQRGTFTIIAVNHDPNKFARVEYGLKFDPTPYSVLGQLLAAPLPTPSDVTARDYIAGVGTTTLVRATVSFTPAADPRVIGAEVRAVGPEQRLMASNGSSADFDGLQLGSYVFGVRSTGRDGRVSIWVDSDPVLVDGLADPPSAVTGLTAIGGALRVALSWNKSSARDVLHYEVWRAPSLANGQHPFPKDAFTMSGLPADHGGTLLGHIDTTTYDDAGDILGPDEGWGYWVRPINTTQVPGAFAGPAIAVTTYYLTDNLEEAIRNTAPIAQALLPDVPTFVDSLPAVGTPGQFVILKSDGKLYRWDATLNNGQGGWYQVVPIIPDSAGQIPVSVIKGIESAIIGQSLTQDQIDQVRQAVLDGNITSDDITSLVGSKVTGLLSNAQLMAGRIYDVDPVTGQTVAGVSVNTLLGNLSATRIFDVNPVTGQTQQGISALSLLGTLNTSVLPAIPTSILTGDVLAANTATLNLASTKISGALAATKITDIDPTTGNTVVGVSVNRLLGSIPTSKLTGAIQASSIKDADPLTGAQISGLLAARVAGQLVASQIAAGAITAEKLTIGSPNNLISNSCWSVSADQWASSGVLTPILGSGFAATWAPAETDGGLFVQMPSSAQGSDLDALIFAPDGTNSRPYYCSISVAPGTTYEAQVRYINQVGSVQLFLLFSDDSALLSSPGSARSYAVPPNGTNHLGDWQQLVVRATAPAGAKYAGLLIRLYNPGPGNQAPSVFLTQALLGVTVPNATQPLVWVPGGVTSISGGMVRSNTIIARNIAAATISGDKIEANAITTRELAIGSGSNSIANSCFAVSTEGWTSGTSGGGSTASLGICAAVHQTYLTSDGVGAVDFHLQPYGYADIAYQAIACRPGDTLEAQAMLLPIGAPAAVYLEYLDKAGAHVAYGAQFSPSVGPQPIPSAAAQGTLTPFTLTFLIDVVPAGAASVLLKVRISTGSGAADGYGFVTRTGLGVTVPGATQPSAWTPGGATSIGGGVIRTEAIVARNLAAGSVSADKIVVAASANVIGNPTCQITAWGWQSGSTCPNTRFGSAAGSDGIAPGYALAGEGSGVITADTMAGGNAQTMYVYWDPDGIGGVPCLPGEWWEQQAFIGAHRCYALLQLQFFDAGGNRLSDVNGDRVAGQGGGASLSSFGFSWCKAQAPAGAAFVRGHIVALNDGAGDIGFGTPGTTPYLFWTRAVLGRSTSLPKESGAQPQPYQIGGTTQVVGGQIATDAITARHLSAGSVSTDELAANSVSTLKLQAGAVVADSIFSGAVTTTKLDAGAVTAEKLAIGSNANVISNPSCALTTDGWQNFSAAGSVFGVNLPGFFPTGEGAGYVNFPGTLGTGQSLTVGYVGLGSYGTPVVPGTWYEAQAKVAAHRVANVIQLQFLKADGTAASGNWVVGSARGVAGGGTTMAGYALLWAKGQAPSDAAFARLIIYGLVDGQGGYSNSTGSDIGVNAYLFWTQASLGVSTPVAMSQSSPQPYAPGGVTVITGGVIESDTIIGRHIAAGTISADKLTIGGGGNVIWNSCLPISADGWVIGLATVSGASVAATSGSIALLGSGSGAISYSGQIPNGAAGFIDAAWKGSSGGYGQAVPCTPGTVWEGQAQVHTAGCTGNVRVVFYDGNGTLLQESIGTSTNGPNDTGHGAIGLDQYQRLTAIGTAPAGAIFVSLIVRMSNSVASGQFLVFTQTMLAQTVANATEVSPWSQGGMVRVTPGLIESDAITSRVIAANQITARELAIGNSVNQIANSCCAVAFDGWSLSGNGTIGAYGSCASVYPQFATTDGCGIVETALQPGQYTDVAYDQITCQAGDTLEAQAMLLTVANSGKLYMIFLGSVGNLVAYSSFSNIVPIRTPMATSEEGTLLAFGLASLIAVVPVGAVFVRLVIRYENDTAGYGTGYGGFTRTALGKTVAGATQVSAWSPGGITSIGGGIIKTESVVARNLAAGSVTAEKIVVAASANVIGNPTCPVTTWGWRYGSTCPNTIIGAASGVDNIASGYALTGEGSGALHADSMNGDGSQEMFVFWDPDSIGGVSCLPGEWWELQAYIGAHRCYALVQLQFFDASGTFIANTNGDRIAGPAGGTHLSDYGFSWCKAQAPAGAAFARGHITALNDNGSDIGAGAGSSPYLFWTRAVLGRSTPLTRDQGAQPQPYQIGGVTQINGGAIKTGTLTARNIGAGEITAEKLAIGSASNVIWNGCGYPSVAGWSSAVSLFSEAPTDTWGLAGYGSFAMHQPAGLTAGTYMDAIYNPNPVPAGTAFGAGVPCSPGEIWEAQALVMTHRCSAAIYVIFAGATLANGYSATSSASFAALPPSSGHQASDYHLISVRAVAPAGTTAVTIIVRAFNDGTAQATFPGSAGTDPYLFFTKVGLGPVATPNAPTLPWGPGGMTSISGSQIQTGTVNTLQLTAGAVTAAQIDAASVRAAVLVAGSVTAEMATFGYPSNVIWNPCMDQGFDGWGKLGHPDLGPLDGGALVLNAAVNSNQNYGLTGYGSGFAQYLGTGPVFSGQYFGWYWAPTAGISGVPVQMGKTYGAAALIMAGNNARVVMDIVWLDYNRNPISTSYSATTVMNNAGGNGLAEYEYQRVSVADFAPSGTAFAQFRMYATGTDAGSYQPFFAFTKAQFGPMPDGATVVGDWVPGGVTAISGGMIKTGTLDAAKINAGTIAAATGFIQTLTATTVTAGNIKAVLVNTNRLTSSEVDADTLVVGTVKAGAIGADQIAGNAIFARHLASEELITLSAQIGVAVIGAAQIGDLQVGSIHLADGGVITGKIGVGGVTQIASGVATGGSASQTATTGGLAIANGTNGVLLFFRAYLPGVASSYASGGNDSGTDQSASGLNEIDVEWTQFGNWVPIYSITTGMLGVSADFLIWNPPGVGTFQFRCRASAGANGNVGRVSIVALAVNR